MKQATDIALELTVGDLRSHRRLCRTVAGATSFLMLVTASAPAFAGTAVLGGDATLTGAMGANLAQNADAYAQFVSTGGASAVLDWSKFNVGAGKEMNFDGAGTTFFNLVDASASKSQVDGIISGNGSVWVINPNGIAFGAASQVNVGGLFAAAAGNVSNADALRDGTATLPTFSSFEGGVTTAEGAKFTADQVALMGKTVSAANADFTGTGNLAIGAASSLVVDEVAGGRVTVNLESFVERTADQLDLGTLNVAGEVRAVTDGKLSVNGEITAGSVYLKSGGALTANKDITADQGDLQLLTQDGDIVVNRDANIVAHGDAATLQVQAGQNLPTLDDHYRVVYSEGDVQIDGNLVTDGANGTVSVFGGYNGLGDVQINGTISSSGNVKVFTENGSVAVAQGADVNSSGDGATVRIYTGISAYNYGGDIDIAGDVEVSGDGAAIDVESAYNYYTDGSVNVSGTIKATKSGGSISISSGNGYSINPGNTKVSGTVEADFVSLAAYDKDVIIEKGATVKSGTYASLVSMDSVKSEGTIDVQTGMLNVLGNTGTVDVSGKVSASMATFKAKGSVDVQNVNNAIGFLSAEGSSVAVLNGNQLNVSKATATDGNVMLGTIAGGISVLGEVASAGKDGNVTLVTALGKDQSGDVLVGSSGKLLAEQEGGMVMIRAGYGEGSSGSVSVLGQVKSHDTASVVASGGQVLVLGEVSSDAGQAILSATEGMIVGGTVASAGTTSLEGGSGTAVIMQGASVKSTSGSVLVSADGTVSIGGALDSAGLISATSRGASVSIAEQGDVKAKNSISLGAAKSVVSAGSVAVSDGALIATAQGGNVNLFADGTGSVKAHGASLHAKGSVSVSNPKNQISGDITASGTSIQIASGTGDMNIQGVQASKGFVADAGTHAVTVSGAVIASDAVGLYGGNVDVRKGGSVTVTGKGAIIDIVAAGDLAGSGNASIDGSLKAETVQVNALGGLSVAGDIASSGEVVTWTAGDMNVSGNIAGSTVSMQSSGAMSVGANAHVLATGYKTVDLGGGVSANQAIDMVAVDGDLSVSQGAVIEATNDKGGIYINAIGATANVAINGSVSAGGTASVSGHGSEVSVSGDISGRDTAEVAAYGGDVRIDGSVGAGELSFVNAASDIIVNGTVQADSTSMVSAGNGVRINGNVRGGESAAVFSGKDGIALNGKVVADGQDGFAMLQSDGDVRFSSNGSLSGTKSASIVAKGDLTQEAVDLPYADGRMEAVSLRPAVSSDEIVLEIGGSIGGGKYSPFVIDGKIYAIAFGDMSLAAAYGRSLEGGNASSVAAARNTAQYAISSARKMLDGTLTLEESLARMANPSDFDDNALLYAAGDMYLYTAGQLKANSYVGAGGNMTVSAATFGDMSYLEAGGLLTINNVGSDKTPQVAYFESVDGVEPKINNQPNDTVIFVDGRLAGGNLRILNQFGANEAFLVQTPELKSTQGIFGNPTFLHSDLDVANPMEVSAIDYMLQETPRLTLDKDFPQEADRHVDSVVIPEKDSIQFGREAKNETVTAADDTVAMVR